MYIQELCITPVHTLLSKITYFFIQNIVDYNVSSQFLQELWLDRSPVVKGLPCTIVSSSPGQYIILLLNDNTQGCQSSAT